MAGISNVVFPNNESYDLISKRTRGIYRVSTDSASTATAFVVTITGITELYDGLTMLCKNTKIASASGCTINLNGLGAKRIWVSQGNSYCTTHWALNQTYLFVYDGTNERWELQQGRDTNSDTYDRLKYSATIQAGASALVAKNIIVANGNGLYQHLKSGTEFDIRWPILYLNSACAANKTTTDTYAEINMAIATTQALTMTAYKPVYIKGTLVGTTFTPISTTPLTQEIETTEGYYYIKLGCAYSGANLRLERNHTIYVYDDGADAVVPFTFSRSSGGSGNIVFPTDADMVAPVKSERSTGYNNAKTVSKTLTLTNNSGKSITYYVFSIASAGVGSGYQDYSYPGANWKVSEITFSCSEASYIQSFDSSVIKSLAPTYEQGGLTYRMDGIKIPSGGSCLVTAEVSVWGYYYPSAVLAMYPIAVTS